MKIYNNLNDFNKNEYKDSNLIGIIGNFDGMHIGHRKIINFMENYSKKFLNSKKIFITFEPHTKLFFQNQKNFLILDQEEKKLFAEKFGFDIFLSIKFDSEFSKNSAEDFIEKILIDKIGLNALFAGKNFCFGKGRVGNKDLFLESRYKEKINFFEVDLEKMDIVDAPQSQNEEQIYSSSLVRKLISNGSQINLANSILGYNFFIRGVVEKGAQRGRTIGFPTANIYPSDEKFLPKLGVYEVSILICDDKKEANSKLFEFIFNKDDNCPESESVKKKYFKAVANIGIKPTFDEHLKSPVLEVHLLGFQDDLYGKFLTIKFEKFIRSEKKFDSIESLKKQIQDDIKTIKI